VKEGATVKEGGVDDDDDEEDVRSPGMCWMF
jgi:hypothetical protein